MQVVTLQSEVRRNRSMAKIALPIAVVAVVIAGYFAFLYHRADGRLSRIEVVLHESRASLKQSQENGRLINAGIASIEARLGIPVTTTPRSSTPSQRNAPPAATPTTTETPTTHCPLNVLGVCIPAG